jgi:hypothetical protein
MLYWVGFLNPDLREKRHRPLNSFEDMSYFKMLTESARSFTKPSRLNYITVQREQEVLSLTVRKL